MGAEQSSEQDAPRRTYATTREEFDKRHVQKVPGEKYTLRREQTLEWASNLRFLTSDSSADVEFTITRSPGCVDYVAVSYCWASAVKVDGAKEYLIRTENGSVRECKAASDVIRRSSEFAKASGSGCELLWIDQESIDQDDPLDKCVGIQSMDVVYSQASLSVGLIHAKIESQDQVNVLAIMLSGHVHQLFPSKNELSVSCAVEDTEVSSKIESIEVLMTAMELIYGDPWWSRLWVLQESMLALDMYLLIRCSSALIKPESLGKIHGELVVSLSKLIYETRDLAWKWLFPAGRIGINFTNDQESSFSRLPWQSLPEWRSHWDDWIDKFAKLNTFQGSPRPQAGVSIGSIAPKATPTLRYSCSAKEAMLYMSMRENSVVSDRLAIIGNICDYQTRLDATALAQKGFDLSVCLHSLALLNGDLTLCRTWATADGIGTTIFGEIKHYSGPLGFSWGPRFLEALVDDEDPFSFVTDFQWGQRLHFRCSFSESGLNVTGWLWKRTKQSDFPETKAAIARLWSILEEPKLGEPPNIANLRFEIECLWTFVCEAAANGHFAIIETLMSALKTSCNDENAEDQADLDREKKSMLLEHMDGLDTTTGVESSSVVESIGFSKIDFVRVIMDIPPRSINSIIMGLIKNLKTKGSLDCYSLLRVDGTLDLTHQVFFDGWNSPALSGQDCEYVFTPYSTRERDRPLADHGHTIGLHLEAISWPCSRAPGGSASELLAGLGSVKGILRLDEDVMDTWIFV